VSPDAADGREVLKRQLAEKENALAREREAGADRHHQWMRRTFAACVALVAAVAAVIMGVAGYLTTTPRWIALGCSLVLVSIFCVAYAKSRTVKWWWLAGGGVAAIAISILTNVLPQPR